MSHPPCRFCGTALEHSLTDLGVSPVSNAFLAPSRLDRMEPFFPLDYFFFHLILACVYALEELQLFYATVTLAASKIVCH